MPATPPACWTLTDGAAGNVRQAEALARALDLPATARTVHIAAPWDWFAPRRLPGALGAIRDAGNHPLVPPWPAIAIGCGRRAALASRLVRERSEGTSFVVQILDPRIDPRTYDLVIAPAHDALRGGNVLPVLGSLNPVDDAWLAAGREAFPSLAALPAPRTVVLIGGSTRAQRIDARYAAGLLERLRALHADTGGSFLVSVSRRTPPALTEAFRRAFATLPGTFRGDLGDGPNPYAGFLGWGDRIVATPDSVNMLSEACAVGVPVFTHAPTPVRGKLAAFHEALRETGHLLELGEPAPATRPPPLRETARIAALVRERMAER